MAQNIDPALLAQILAGQNPGGYYLGNGGGSWQGGDAGYGVQNPDVIYRPWDGGGGADVFNQQGQYQGQNTGMDNGDLWRNFIIGSLAMYGGANALAGMGGGTVAGGAGADIAAAEGAGTVAGGSGGVGIGGSAISLTPAEIAAGVTAPSSASVMATMPALSGAAAGGAAAGGLLGSTTGQQAAGALGTSGVNSMRQGEISGYESNGSLPSSAAVDYGDRSRQFLGLDYSTWAKLASAALGAASSGDQQQSSSQTREPWGPAQQLIKDNIASTGLLQQYYQQNPMNQQQQQGYANQFGLLNAANQQMPAWLAAMNANSSGANNYDPKKPRTLIGGTSQAPTFGLLNPNYRG